MARFKTPPQDAASFGQQYTVLNLDFMSILTNSLRDTPEGFSFLSNCKRWLNAVHGKTPKPLIVFTTLCFSHETQPELTRGSPFSKIIAGLGPLDKSSDAVQIDPELSPKEGDIVLQKTRLYAGSGNSLEQILRARNIKTVILSGLTASGVVLSTAYRLLDLDYEVYIIKDTVTDLPVAPEGGGLNEALTSLMGNVNAHVISLDEALQMLGKSSYFEWLSHLVYLATGTIQVPCVEQVTA